MVWFYNLNSSAVVGGTLAFCTNLVKWPKFYGSHFSQLSYFSVGPCLVLYLRCSLSPLPHPLPIRSALVTYHYVPKRVCSHTYSHNHFLYVSCIANYSETTITLCIQPPLMFCRCIFTRHFIC